MTIEGAYGRVPATDFPDLKFERSPHEPPETPVDPPSRTAFDVVDESGLLRLRRYRPDNLPGNGPAVVLVYSFVKGPDRRALPPGSAPIRNLAFSGVTLYNTRHPCLGNSYTQR